MKHSGLLMVTMALLSMTSCNHKSSSTDGNTFDAFAEHFSKATSFAYAEVSGREVLLVSQETFGNNMNADKEAIEASIFAQDNEGKIVALGSIRSQGTLYPVSLLDGKIMVAGHQFVRIYSIKGEDVPELVLDSYGEGEGQEIEALFKTFEKGTPVRFSKTKPMTPE